MSHLGESALALHQQTKSSSHDFARCGIVPLGYLFIDEARQRLGQGDVAGVRNRHAVDIEQLAMVSPLLTQTRP